MMLLICILAFMSLSNAMTTTTLSPVDAFKLTVRRDVTAMWAAADSNHDGHFGADDMETIFNDYDDNGDNQISEAEFRTDFTANVSGLGIVADGLFLELDMDRDNRITKSDIRLYYQRIDTNDDGTVEKVEFINYFTNVMTLLFVIQYEKSASEAPPAVGVGK